MVTDDIGGVLDVTVINDVLFEEPLRLSVLTDRDESRTVLAHFVELKLGFRRRRISARMFWCMARACNGLDIKTIYSQGLASSDKSSASKKEWSGAVTALTFGFDGQMPDEWLQTLPESLRHLRYLRDVVDTEVGAIWWKANPKPLKLTFDPRPGSKSMEILDAYIRRNNIRLSQ